MNILDFINSCRICLCNEATIPIFGNNNGEWIDISDKLAEVFGEKIVDVVQYPRHICECCYDKVNDTINFVNKFKESNRVLQEALLNFVKHEVEDHIDSFENDCNDNDFEIENDEINMKHEPIIFDNAEQFQELIKKCAKQKSKAKEIIPEKSEGSGKRGEINHQQIGHSPDPKSVPPSKRIQQCKTKNKAETKIKNKHKRHIRNKNTCVKNNTNDVITKAILEGEFRFSSGQWSTRCPDKKIGLKRNEIKSTIIDFFYQKGDPDKDIKTTKKIETKKKFLCEQCGAEFDKSSNLLSHKRGHSERETCAVCNKKYVNTHCLRKHIARVHSEDKKNILCNICGNKFAFEPDLRMHHKNVHAKTKKVPKKLPCDICGRLLSTAKCLLLHKRIHTGERPHECSICSKKFAHVAYLRDHMRLHTGETPHKCPACGKGFAQHCNMKSHIKHNHRISQLDESMLKTIHQRYLRLMKP